MHHEMRSGSGDGAISIWGVRLFAGILELDWTLGASFGTAEAMPSPGALHGR